MWRSFRAKYIKIIKNIADFLTLPHAWRNTWHAHIPVVVIESLFITKKVIKSEIRPLLAFAGISAVCVRSQLNQQRRRAWRHATEVSRPLESEVVSHVRSLLHTSSYIFTAFFLPPSEERIPQEGKSSQEETARVGQRHGQCDVTSHTITASPRCLASPTTTQSSLVSATTT